MRLGKYGESVLASTEASTLIKTFELLLGSALCMFNKCPDQIWHGREGDLKVNAVHEQLRRQALWQAFFVVAGYEEAEPTSGNVTLGSRNPSVLLFLALQFNGLCRAHPLDHDSRESQAHMY
ncbi:hypothetical protein SUGI_0663240 [Cryptomeria japonica]|nr:hypothetical protein SUGI_0663240 [Cryptomeria japonica]